MSGDRIRFRLPLIAPDQATQAACESLIGQDTRVDGHPALITAAWLVDGGIEVEIELSGRFLPERQEVLPGMHSIAPGPDRLPQGSFRTKAEALAYARSLPPRYHVIGEDGEIVPCDHPACEHCRGRERRG